MGNLNSAPLFFLGANSGVGFVSRFGESYDPQDGWRAFIIKGGAGTGKSTFMKRIATYFIKQGVRCHLCPCSSDPSSLDGVILPDIKRVILDGTAPHIVEPRLVGCCENILNFGSFWNSEKLYESRNEIISLSKQNAAYHKQAANYISAAALLKSETAALAARHTDSVKVKKSALKTAKKFIPKDGGNGRCWERFLGAVTPSGTVFYKKTVEKLCETRVVIADEYGAVAPLFLETVADYALKSGHEIIICRCPLRPESIEHIIIPSLSLGFTTANRFHRVDSDLRTIHARRFCDVAALHSSRDVLSFNRRAILRLTDTATEVLQNAKSTHDEIEKLYAAAMDYAPLDSLVDTVIEKIKK